MQIALLNMIKFISCLILFICIQLNVSYSQDTIFLNNPSFEDTPRRGGAAPWIIQGWKDCGIAIFPGESPPDIHPVPEAAWEVSKKPVDGTTYLGLVTRFNETYESLSQELEKPLKAGKCYRISGYVAVSLTYRSMTSRSTNTLENFIKPVRFLVAGGNESCSWDEVLVFVGPVSNTEWQEFRFDFTPQKDYNFIIIGAFFEEGYLEPYNGHVLVDGLSPIFEINCD